MKLSRQKTILLESNKRMCYYLFGEVETMTVGEKIRAARKAANWTQAELASTCDLATITIRQYENGTRTPNLKTLERISIELGIDPIELLPDEVTASWKSGKSFGASETWNEFYRYGYHVFI